MKEITKPWGMLTQEHGKHRPSAYYSTQFDAVARTYPNCLKAVAAKLAEASADLTLGNDIYLQTPHIVQGLLNSELPQHCSANRLTSYEILLLSPPKLH